MDSPLLILFAYSVGLLNQGYSAGAEMLVDERASCMVAFANIANGQKVCLYTMNLQDAGSRLLQMACLTGVILMVSGCASSASNPYANSAAPDDYFAMSLPDMPNGDNVMMSPVIRAAVDQTQRQAIYPTLTMVRQALLSQHQRWVGTPYRLGGTNERGIDCSALIQNVYRDTFNMELPRTTRQQVKQGRLVNRSELQAGDLVFFKPPGPYRHAGIYIGDGRFMHASSSRGVMISRLDNSYWKRYYWQSRRALEPTQLAGLGASLRR